MEDFFDVDDLGVDGVDLNKTDSVQVSLSSLEIGNEKVKRTFFTIPTCSCPYVKWSAKRYLIDAPDFGSSLRPTKVDGEEQCIYCGFFVRWEKLFVSMLTSDAIPFWALPSWFNAPDEATWFTRYKKDLERLDQLIVDSEKESPNNDVSELIETSPATFIN